MLDKRLELLKEAWGMLESVPNELEEMIIHGNEGTDIIAYQGHVWILPERVPTDVANKIIVQLLPSSYDEEQLPFVGEEPDVASDEVGQIIYDADRSDILVGSLANGVLSLRSPGGFTMDPKSSLLIKRVVKALKVKKVSYDDDLDGNIATVPKKKITGEIPDYAYHGTALAYLPGILKRGIEPRSEQSNYATQGIYHDDKIFFATRFGEASHHGVTAGAKTKSKSVVLEFRIPDKNAVIADYDVDMHGGETTYDSPNRKTHTKFGSEKSLALSREFGVYGYAGKILPQHIKYVYVATKDEIYSNKDYKRFTIKQLRTLMNRYGDLEVLGY